MFCWHCCKHPKELDHTIDSCDVLYMYRPKSCCTPAKIILVSASDKWMGSSSELFFRQRLSEAEEIIRKMGGDLEFASEKLSEEYDQFINEKFSLIGDYRMDGGHIHQTGSQMYLLFRIFDLEQPEDDLILNMKPSKKI